MNEDDAFEAWWRKHQRENWEHTLSADERAAGKPVPCNWGLAYKWGMKQAWMARATSTVTGEPR